jgi:hypothetical protein
VKDFRGVLEKVSDFVSYSTFEGFLVLSCLFHLYPTANAAGAAA